MRWVTTPRSPAVGLLRARHKSCSLTRRPEDQESPTPSKPPALLRSREAPRKGLAEPVTGTIHSAFLSPSCASKA